VRRPPRRKLLRLALLALLFLVATAALLRTQYAADTLCGQVRARLPALLGMDVQVDRCEIDPFAQTVTFHDLRATPKSGSGAPATLGRLSADAIELGLPGVDALHRRLTVDRIVLTRPRVALDLSHAGETAKEEGSCPLDLLKRVQVRRLEVVDANLSVALSEGKGVQLEGLNLGWLTRRGVADFHLDAGRGLVQLGPGAQSLSLSKLFAEGALDPAGESVELSRTELALEDVNLLVSGNIETLCHPRLDLDAQLFLPLHTLARAVALQEKTKGHLWAHATLTGPAATPRVTGEVVGQGLVLGDFTPGDFKTRLSVEGALLTVSDFTTSFGPGTVRAGAVLKLLPGLPLKAHAELESAELGPILDRASVKGSWVDFFTSGKVAVQGSLSPLSLHGDADLKLRDFVLASHAFNVPVRKAQPILAFPQAHLHTQVAVLPDRVELDAPLLESGRSKLKLKTTLFFNPARGLLIDGSAENVELGELKAIAGIPWEGRGKARFHLDGPYAQVRIDSQVSLRDFTMWGYALGVTEGRVTYADGVLGFPAITGQKGRSEYFGAGNVDFRGKEVVTRMSAQIPHGRVEDLVDVIAGLSPNFETLQHGVLRGQVSGTMEIDGPASTFGGSIALQVKDATYYDRRMGDGGFHFRFVDGQALVLDPATLTGPLGVTHADGTLSFAGPLDYRFSGEPISLPELVGPARAQALGITGTLAFSGKVGGDTTTPVITGYLTSPRVTLADKNLGSTHLEMRMEGREGQIWGHPFADSSTSIQFTSRDPYPYTASLRLSLPEIRPLLPDVALTRGLSGALKGAIDAKGQLFEPDTAQVHAVLDQLALSRGDFQTQNDGPIVLDYDRGKLTVEALQLKGPNTNLSVSGWASPKSLNMRLMGGLDLRLIESVLPRVDRAGGRLEVSASASGSLRSPSMAGSAELSDARIKLRDQPVELRSLSGHVDFSEARVLFDDLTGVLNDGRVSLHGDLSLRRFSPERLQIVAQLDDVTFRPMEDLPVTTTGELTLSGTPDQLSIAGDLDLTHVRYDRPLALDSFLQDVGKRSALGGGGGESAPWLKLDVGFHLADVRIDNNIARAKLLGNVRLVGDNARPSLVGALETAEGSQASFRGNQFNIGQGLLEFKGEGFDGLFDMHAETQVREYLVRLHAFGRISDPKAVLSADPALAEGDILSLLTLGVVSKDRNNTAGTSAGLAAEALFNASGLDRQVQRFLPKNPVLRDLAFHISTTYNDATGQVEPTAQLESKFLTERLKLVMTQPVSGRGTRAQAEYQFTNRFSAQAQWDNEHSDLSFGNLGMDLKLRWEVE